MITSFFIICLLALPWIIFPFPYIADPFRIPKEMFFDIICMGMIVLSLFKGVRFQYKNKYLGWFSLWVFITIILNWFLPISLTFNNRSCINIWTIKSTIHFILGLYMVYIMLSYFEKEDYIRIAKAICLSSILISLFCFLQKFGLDPFGTKIAYYNHPNHFSAFLDNPNIVADYLCLSLPFFLYFNELKYKIGFLIILTALYFANSVLAIGVSVLGLIIFLCFNYRNKIVWYSCLVFINIIVLVSYYNFIFIKNLSTDRIGIFKSTLSRLKENPLFGQGLGIFQTWSLQNNLVVSVWKEVHNDWLQIACEIGVLGVIAIFFIVFNSIKNFNYRQDNKLGLCYFVSFISFLLLMCGSFPLYVAPTALLGLIAFCGVEKI